MIVHDAWVQLSRAPSAFMSSKNAMYESSILGGFDAELLDSCFATGGATIGRLGVGRVDDVFGFGFGRADSLLTRTDAGICKRADREAKFPWQDSIL